MNAELTRLVEQLDALAEKATPGPRTHALWLTLCEVDFHVALRNAWPTISAHLRSQQAKRTYSDMTIAELMQERGRIDFALQLKVCGDPSKGIAVAASPPAGEGGKS